MQWQNNTLERRDIRRTISLIDGRSTGLADQQLNNDRHFTIEQHRWNQINKYTSNAQSKLNVPQKMQINQTTTITTTNLNVPYYSPAYIGAITRCCSLSIRPSHFLISVLFARWRYTRVAVSNEFNWGSTEGYARIQMLSAWGISLRCTILVCDKLSELAPKKTPVHFLSLWVLITIFN